MSIEDIERTIEENRGNAEELRKIYRSISELVGKGRVELAPLMSRVREYLSNVETERKPPISLVKLSSLYYDKIRDAHQILSLLEEQYRLRLEEGGKMPVSAKENLNLALGYLESQIKTAGDILGGLR